MRYFFHISYKGTKYRGWQRQLNVVSVQAVIEDNLSKILKEKTICIGCGRTDAGVHSSQYFFHINTDKIWTDHHFFVVNKILPSDIVVHDVFEVDTNHHAQTSAKERTYNYFIHTKKNPFLNEISTYYQVKPDWTKMAKAAAIFSKYRDFRSFCKSPDNHNHTRCNIYSLQLFADSSETIFRVQITANRFLRGMIRILVHELMEVGTGQKSIEEFEEMIKCQIPSKFLKLARAQGLYLSKVKYPFMESEPINDFCSLLTMNQWTPIDPV